MSVVSATAGPNRRVFRPAAARSNRVPDSLLNDPELTRDVDAVLPKNYNFEVPKTLWRIQTLAVKRVALQLPEGLTMFATALADILKKHSQGVLESVVIMADVTYGACCVDDFSAKALGCDLLVHYGHSCLVPVDRTSGIKMLYVFVDIKIDSLHFIQTIVHNFGEGEGNRPRLAFVSTIQFVATLQSTALELRSEHGFQVTIPQSKPLSPGEILGCTSPQINDADILIYLGDGRFHFESAMIANPKLRAFRYDPYSKVFSEEFYDHSLMQSNRRQAIAKAKTSKHWGIILGTLGRQGNPTILELLYKKLKAKGVRVTTLLLSEIFPQKLSLMSDVGAWVQIACPRLSIDWGQAFEKPLLTPYEAAVAAEEAPADWSDHYPMDFYANESLGPWTPNHKEKPTAKKKAIVIEDNDCVTCEKCECRN